MKYSGLLLLLLVLLLSSSYFLWLIKIYLCFDIQAFMSAPVTRNRLSSAMILNACITSNFSYLNVSDTRDSSCSHFFLIFPVSEVLRNDSYLCYHKSSLFRMENVSFEYLFATNACKIAINSEDFTRIFAVFYSNRKINFEIITHYIVTRTYISKI